MMSLNFAHGDLKADNIIVSAGDNLVLVDYDSMFVPALRGREAPDLGGPSFQHPRRTPMDFDAAIDHFPALVLGINLRALAIDPFGFGQNLDSDHLIFRQRDFQSPDHSQIFQNLMAQNDPWLTEATRTLAACCNSNSLAVPDIQRHLLELRGAPAPPLKAQIQPQIRSQNVATKLQGLQQTPLTVLTAPSQPLAGRIASSTHQSYQSAPHVVKPSIQASASAPPRAQPTRYAPVSSPQLSPIIVQPRRAMQILLLALVAAGGLIIVLTFGTTKRSSENIVATVPVPPIALPVPSPPPPIDPPTPQRGGSRVAREPGSGTIIPSPPSPRSPSPARICVPFNGRMVCE